MDWDGWWARWGDRFDAIPDLDAGVYGNPSDPRYVMDPWLRVMMLAALLRHDWCQWEYDLDPSQRWDCEEEWR